MHVEPQLADALEHVVPKPLNGVFHRAVLLKYLMNITGTPEPLYSLGAPATGARFTPPGSMPTLYLAETDQTAYAEALQVNRALANLRPPLQVPKPPLVLLSVEVQLGTILDLTQDDILSALDTTRAELRAPWRIKGRRGKRVPTWELGLAVYNGGRFAGLRYESKLRPNAFCIAVFPERLIGSDSIVVYDTDHNISQRLP